MDLFKMYEGLDCGCFDGNEFPNMTISPMRCCGRYEIEYYLTDAGETYCDDKTYIIRADHIQIAHPGQKRHSQLPFNTMFLKFNADRDLEALLDAAPSYFKASDPKRLRALFEEVISLQESMASALLFCAKISELIDTILSDAIANPGTGNDSDTVSKAKLFMQQHYAIPISLADICKTVNLSATYFHTVFKKACGMTPHEYLAEIRIIAAKKLLWSSDIAIAEVAERTGFLNQQYFSKVFKSRVGISPGAYRKSFRRRYFAE